MGVVVPELVAGAGEVVALLLGAGELVVARGLFAVVFLLFLDEPVAAAMTTTTTTNANAQYRFFLK